MAKNIELKVRCTTADHDRILGQLVDRGLPIVELRQIDRYYAVPHGRLKMRWIDDIEAVLIRYQRPDLLGDRLSTYHLLDLDLAQAGYLDELFVEQFGENVTVRKRRQVGVIQHTRVHLDAVEGLGTFIELETVLQDAPNAESRGHAEYENVVKFLGLQEMEPVAGSYSDLMLGREEVACE